MPNAQANCRRHHLLLGDVHLEEALGKLLLELFGVSRVADLSIEDDQVRANRPDCPKGVAVGTPGRDGCAERICWQGRTAGPACWGCWCGGGGRAGLRHLHADCLDTAEFLDGLPCLLVVQGPAVPAITILEERNAAPLDRPGDDEGGGITRLAGLGVGPVDLIEVVAVDLDGMPAEGAGAPGVGP